MPTASKEYLESVVAPEARQSCGPIFFTHSLQIPAGITNNGSFALVNTGRRMLLVTCHHVWRAYQAKREQHPELMMCLGLAEGVPPLFSPEKPIDEDKMLDLATFDIASILEEGNGRRFFPLYGTQTPRIKKGDQLFLIGFPGHQRLILDSAIAFGRSSYGLRVMSVDDLRFQADVSMFKTTADEFGGMSGSPCFRVRQGEPIQLVGFTTTYSFGLLFFTSARSLNRDGKIKRLAK